MAYKITTTDGQTYEVGDRKLRLASHYWQLIEGEPGDQDLGQPAR